MYLLIQKRRMSLSNKPLKSKNKNQYQISYLPFVANLMNNLFPLASLLAGRRSFLSRDSSSTWDNVSNLRKKEYFNTNVKAFPQQQSYHGLGKHSAFNNTHQHRSTSSSVEFLSQRWPPCQRKLGSPPLSVHLPFLIFFAALIASWHYRSVYLCTVWLPH